MASYPHSQKAVSDGVSSVPRNGDSENGLPPKISDNDSKRNVYTDSVSSLAGLFPSYCCMLEWRTIFLRLFNNRLGISGKMFGIPLIFSKLPF